MRTRKLILTASCTTVLFISFTGNLLAQVSLEMKDMFGEVDDQIQDSFGVIESICYGIAGIAFLVGAITAATKLFKGQEVGKDVGLYFFGMAFFLIAAFLCGKFFE